MKSCRLSHIVWYKIKWPLGCVVFGSSAAKSPGRSTIKFWCTICAAMIILATSGSLITDGLMYSGTGNAKPCKTVLWWKQATYAWLTIFTCVYLCVFVCVWLCSLSSMCIKWLHGLNNYDRVSLKEWMHLQTFHPIVKLQALRNLRDLPDCIGNEQACTIPEGFSGLAWIWWGQMLLGKFYFTAFLLKGTESRLTGFTAEKTCEFRIGRKIGVISVKRWRSYQY